MELLLRAHEDLNSPTWSIIWMLVILLIGVAYYIYTIMKLSFEELENGSNDPTKSEELLQLPSDQDQQSS